MDFGVSLRAATLTDMAHDPRDLPSSLPAPVDDSACDHLLGLRLPDMHLPSTRGGSIGLVSATEGTAVIYVYPRTGVPGVEMPDGWDAIPGARGCTPQSCSYRDDYAAFQGVGVDVYGLSTQSTEAQMEFVEREHIPFPLLSDPGRLLGSVLELPTFTAGGDVLYRRVTLIVEAGRVVHVRYPVFPPNRDAEETLAWLRSTLSQMPGRPSGAAPYWMIGMPVPGAAQVDRTTVERHFGADLLRSNSPVVAATTVLAVCNGRTSKALRVPNAYGYLDGIVLVIAPGTDL